MKKTIGNIGTLDLTETAPETVEEIEKIGNVGVVIVSKATAPLLNRVKIGNVGSTIEMNPGFKVVNGKMELAPNFSAGSKAPVSFLIQGKLEVKPDVKPEEIEQGIDKLVVNGKILCPESLLPVIQSKLASLNGKISSYPDGARVVSGDLDLDDRFLRSLAPGANLYILGNLRMTTDCDPALFSGRIESIGFSGKAVIREECAEAFFRKLGKQSPPQVEIIPAGFRHFDDELALSRLNIRKFDQLGIQAEKTIRIEPDVTEELLRKHIRAIHAKGCIFCPAGLADAVMDLVDDPSARILHYAGRLVLVEDEYSVSREELEACDQVTTFGVSGELSFEADIPASLAKEKIEFIDNFGEIEAPKALLGVIRLKLRTREGEVSASDELTGEDDQGKNVSQNFGFLKL